MLLLNQQRTLNVYPRNGLFLLKISSLLLSLLFLIMHGRMVMAQSTHRDIVIYNGDNGNYGDVTFDIVYYFKGETVFFEVKQIIVEESFKMKSTETELFNAVKRQGIWSSSKYHKSLNGKVTAKVSFGLTKLKNANAQISSSLYGLGQKNFTSFRPPSGADKIVSEYSQKHNSNLYTDNCGLFEWKIISLEMYELDRAVKDLREKLKREKAAHQREFDSKITQASLNGNLGKFDQADDFLKQAWDLINANRSRQQKYDETKEAIQRQKDAAAQKQADLKRQAAKKEADKKAAALQNEQARQKTTTSTARNQTTQQNQPSSQGQAQNKQTGYSNQQTQSQSRSQSQSQPAAPRTQREQAMANAKMRYQNRVAQQLQAQQAAEAQRERQEAARLQAKREQEEAMRHKIAQMKAQLEETNRQAARIESAKDQFLSGLTSSSSDPNQILNSAKPLVNEFAKAGNAGAAYGTVGVALGASIFKMASANKKRKEAEKAAEEQRRKIEAQREAERKRIAAEKERLRKEAFELLMTQRRTILETFSQSDPIPLSTTPIAENTIYYFLYAIDSNSYDQKSQTTVYISNVFAIEKYKDGTWPYQSRIEQETAKLTPFKEQLHGYYTDLEQAQQMRTELVSSLEINEGVSINEVAYRAESITGTSDDLSADNSSTASMSGGLGIPLGAVIKSATGNTPQKDATMTTSSTTARSDEANQKSTKKSTGLGIPLGPPPTTKSVQKAKKDSADTEAKKSTTEKSTKAKRANTGKAAAVKSDGGLGIPIK